MKKKIFLLAFILLSLGACGGTSSTDNSSTINSEIKGTYYNEYEDEKKFVTTFSDSTSNLYATIYPIFNLTENSVIYYRVNQKLILKKDFCYRYVYSIILLNANSVQFAKTEVDISGTYTYKVLNSNGNQYYVELANPLIGNQTIYSPEIVNSADLTSWTIHSTADFSLSIDEQINNPSFSYNVFTKARKVIVTKALDSEDTNVVEDDLYFNFALDYLCCYSTEKSTR